MGEVEERELVKSDDFVLIEGRKILNFSPEEFSIWVPIQVRFCDTDMMGHINNVSMIAFLETARVEYMNRIRDKAKEKNASANIFSVILGELTCVWRQQSFLHEKIRVGIKIPFFKRRSFPFNYIVIAESPSGEVRKVADAQSIQVMFDYGEGKSIDIPDEFINLAEEVEGRKIPKIQG
jgi:acyl-CoA thioester hydrolase